MYKLIERCCDASEQGVNRPTFTQLALDLRSLYNDCYMVTKRLKQVFRQQSAGDGLAINISSSARESEVGLAMVDVDDFEMQMQENETSTDGVVDTLMPESIARRRGMTQPEPLEFDVTQLPIGRHSIGDVKPAKAPLPPVNGQTQQNFGRAPSSPRSMNSGSSTSSARTGASGYYHPNQIDNMVNPIQPVGYSGVRDVKELARAAQRSPTQQAAAPPQAAAAEQDPRRASPDRPGHVNVGRSSNPDQPRCETRLKATRSLDSRFSEV